MVTKKPEQPTAKKFGRKNIKKSSVNASASIKSSAVAKPRSGKFGTGSVVKPKVVSSKKRSAKFKIITACVMAGVLAAGGVVVYLGWFIPRGFISMGMNISATSYHHSRVLMFNDIMKTKHEIGTASYLQGGFGGQLASDGYPLGYTPNNVPYWDSSAPVILINNIYEGNYVLLYDGDGDIGITGGVEITETAENKLYLKLTESESYRWITIRRSNADDHVRNIRIVPAEYEHKESKMPLFRKDYLNGLKTMQALRFMDAQATNNSTQQHWADRPLVSDWAYDTKGLPLEILIELANTLKIDPWFCVPHMASDDYIQNMAKLIKQKLSKTLKFYIEYSNETWHIGFGQGTWIRNNAPGSVDSYVISDLLALRSTRYGSDTNHLKTAYFMARTFRIFQAEFTGKDRSRLQTVGTRYFWEYPREIIEYLIEQGTRPDVMADVGYFNFNEQHHNAWLQDPSAVKAVDIINAVLSVWDEHAASVRGAVKIYDEFDIPYIVYEGGQHMQPYNQGNWEYNQAVWDAQIHPKMYDLYMKNFRLHADLGCKLFMHFGYISARESQWGSWGALENTRDASAKNLKTIAPKYKAILDANKRKGLF